MKSANYWSKMNEKHRIIKKSSVFPAPPDVIWSRLQSFETLRFVAFPLASFTPVGGGKSLVWKAGETFCFDFRLMCLLPYGTHTINVLRFDETALEIYTHEANTHVPVWNHRITLEPLDGKNTRYTDEVELCAGWKTPFVFAWANAFYAHRQRKWQKLLTQ